VARRVGLLPRSATAPDGITVPIWWLDGQRRRVRVSMALAQETGIMLLDEPTTLLDITHQIELLELFTDLHLSGRTLVAVLHDLNHAARYGTHLIAMKEGTVVAEGPPSDIVTAELVEEVFGLHCLAQVTSSGSVVIRRRTTAP
jgi:iron complex transport system ATP-binding protein